MGGQVNAKTYVVEVKTASYTVVMPQDSGKLFTNRGDTDAITFTLPAVTTDLKGCNAKFYSVGASAMGVAGTAGELVTFNDAAANSVAVSTGSEIIGACVEAICDGTSWLILLHTEETQTSTVAT